MLRRAIGCLEKTLEVTIGLLCLTLLGSLFIEVLNRYIFFTAWRELQYIIPFCIIWLVMLGSALAVRRSQHFEVDFVASLLTGKAALFHRCLLGAGIAAAGLLLVWISIRFVQLGTMKRNPATGIEMAYIYASFPTGGILMTLMALSRLVCPPLQKSGKEELL